MNVSSPADENSPRSSTHSKEDETLSQVSLSEDGSSEVHIDEAEKSILEFENNLSVGKSVEDIEQAYLLYCEYGRTKGFSARCGEQRYVGKSDLIRWKEYLCSSAGMPDNKSSSNRVP